MSDRAVQMRLDWVPGMAADMCNYMADLTKKHEADIKSGFSDFSADELRVTRPGDLLPRNPPRNPPRRRPRNPPRRQRRFRSSNFLSEKKKE